MPIEFSCTQCGKLLRTPDGSEGKQARCPQCSAVLNIPTSSQPGGGMVPPPPPPQSPLAAAPAAGANPYQSPTASSQPLAAVEPGSFTPSRIDLDSVLSRTWAIYKSKLGACILATIVMWAVSFLTNLPLNFMMMIVQDASDGVKVLTFLLSYIGIFAVSTFVLTGIAIYFLKIARGQDASIGDLFTGGPYFASTLGAYLLVTIITIVGFMLLVVPGVIAILMLSQFLMLIVDQRVGAIDSLTLSRQITSGNKVTLFLMWLLVGFVGLLITLFTCGLGALFVAPFQFLMMAVSYLMMTGQPTIDPNRPAQQ